MATKDDFFKISLNVRNLCSDSLTEFPAGISPKIYVRHHIDHWNHMHKGNTILLYLERRMPLARCKPPMCRVPRSTKRQIGTGRCTNLCDSDQCPRSSSGCDTCTDSDTGVQSPVEAQNPVTYLTPLLHLAASVIFELEMYEDMLSLSSHECGRVVLVV